MACELLTMRARKIFENFLVQFLAFGNRNKSKNYKHCISKTQIELITIDTHFLCLFLIPSGIGLHIKMHYV